MGRWWKWRTRGRSTPRPATRTRRRCSRPSRCRTRTARGARRPLEGDVPTRCGRRPAAASTRAARWRASAAAATSRSCSRWGRGTCRPATSPGEVATIVRAGAFRTDPLGLPARLLAHSAHRAGGFPPCVPSAKARVRRGRRPPSAAARAKRVPRHALRRRDAGRRQGGPRGTHPCVALAARPPDERAAGGAPAQRAGPAPGPGGGLPTSEYGVFPVRFVLRRPRLIPYRERRSLAERHTVDTGNLFEGLGPRVALPRRAPLLPRRRGPSVARGAAAREGVPHPGRRARGRADAPRVPSRPLTCRASLLASATWSRSKRCAGWYFSRAREELRSPCHAKRSVLRRDLGLVPAIEAADACARPRRVRLTR